MLNIDYVIEMIMQARLHAAYHTGVADTWEAIQRTMAEPTTVHRTAASSPAPKRNHTPLQIQRRRPMRPQRGVLEVLRSGASLRVGEIIHKGNALGYQLTRTQVEGVLNRLLAKRWAGREGAAYRLTLRRT